MTERWKGERVMPWFCGCHKPRGYLLFCCLLWLLGPSASWVPLACLPLFLQVCSGFSPSLLTAKPQLDAAECKPTAQPKIKGKSAQEMGWALETPGAGLGLAFNHIYRSKSSSQPWPVSHSVTVPAILPHPGQLWVSIPALLCLGHWGRMDDKCISWQARSSKAILTVKSPLPSHSLLRARYLIIPRLLPNRVSLTKWTQYSMRNWRFVFPFSKYLRSTYMCQALF